MRAPAVADLASRAIYRCIRAVRLLRHAGVDEFGVVWRSLVKDFAVVTSAVDAGGGVRSMSRK